MKHFYVRSDFTVRVGSSNLIDYRASDQEIYKVVSHPLYDNQTFYYDVSLIRLRKVEVKILEL